MITLGVDLAAQPKNTAACVVNWQTHEATVEKLETGVTDDRLLGLAETADKVGIDVPFGWPEAFVRAVTAHHAQRPWTTASGRELRLRRTDLFVHLKTGKWPLSVSTDKIAIPALRAAALMCRLAEAGFPVDRTGAGRFAEVYPAAALRQWVIASGAKDTPNLIATLCQHAPWLKLCGEAHALCSKSRDACDSLIASLVVRAAAIGLCEQMPESDRARAVVEGWIALPVIDSLPRLLGIRSQFPVGREPSAIRP